MIYPDWMGGDFIAVASNRPPDVRLLAFAVRPARIMTVGYGDSLRRPVKVADASFLLEKATASIRLAEYAISKRPVDISGFAYLVPASPPQIMNATYV
jgi:hypothetical protein